jgi:hypothetical protein
MFDFSELLVQFTGLILILIYILPRLIMLILLLGTIGLQFAE